MEKTNKTYFVDQRKITWPFLETRKLCIRKCYLQVSRLIFFMQNSKKIQSYIHRKHEKKHDLGII